jgi:hypothetical protein
VHLGQRTIEGPDVHLNNVTGCNYLCVCDQRTAILQAYYNIIVIETKRTAALVSMGNRQMCLWTKNRQGQVCIRTKKV